MCFFTSENGSFVLVAGTKKKKYSTCAKIQHNQMATNNKTKPTKKKRVRNVRWENGNNLLLYYVSYNMCFALENCLEFL